MISDSNFSYQLLGSPYFFSVTNMGRLDFFMHLDGVAIGEDVGYPQAKKGDVCSSERLLKWWYPVDGGYTQSIPTI